MSLRFIGVSSLCFSLLSTTTFSFAKTEQVPCPPVTAIQQSAQLMDETRLQENGTYTVFRGYQRYSFQDKYAIWDVSVSKVYAHSEKDALIIGKYILQQTSFKKNEIVDESNKEIYVCQYGPGDILALGFHL